MNRMLRWAFRAPVCLYRAGLGRVLGHRFMLLAHIGRRTGLRRYTVLEVLEYRPEGPEVVVMNGFGPNANWFRNLPTTPDPQVVTGSNRFITAYRILEQSEAVSVLAGYEARRRLVAPLIRVVLSRLAGWRYGASDADRARLVTELPLVAFRPRREQRGALPPARQCVRSAEQPIGPTPAE